MAGLFGILDDLHSFDPVTMTWTLLSAANDTRRPSARCDHGFTSAGGRLYVHGGSSYYEGDGDALGRGYVSDSKGNVLENGGWESWGYSLTQAGTN